VLISTWKFPLFQSAANMYRKLTKPIVSTVKQPKPFVQVLPIIDASWSKAITGRGNLDSHVSRIDLIGKDAIVLKDGKQVTEFRDGLLPWALQNPVALTFDEYDAGRPDVMFVIQRILEAHGRLTLLDQNKVIVPHSAFRIFANGPLSRYAAN